MNPNPKSTKEAMPGAAPFEAAAGFPTAMAGLYAKAVERAVQAQKTALDVAVQQSTETVEAVKKALPPMPGMFLFDMASQAMEQCVETQKKVLDMMVEQNAAVVEYSQQRGDQASKVIGGFSGLMQESVERNVSTQKTVLNFAAEQYRVANEAMKKQAGSVGIPAAAMTAADSIQKGMDALIDTQKELLDIAAKPLKYAAKA